MRSHPPATRRLRGERRGAGPRGRRTSSRRRAERAARAELQEGLGWLRGFPAGDAWCVLPRLGRERGSRARLRREPLDEASRRERFRTSRCALRALERRFPRALERVVGEVGAWRARVELRLRALGERSEGGEWLAARELLSARPRKLRRAWGRWLADPELAPLGQAAVWAFLDEAELLTQAPRRLARWEPWLRELLRRAPDHGLELALRACEDSSARGWGPLLAALGDPRRWEVPQTGAEEARSFAARVRESARFQRGSGAPLPFSHRPLAAGPRLLRDALELSGERDAAARRRARALASALADTQPLAEWAEWWSGLRPLVRRARQLSALRRRSPEQRALLREQAGALQAHARRAPRTPGHFGQPRLAAVARASSDEEVTRLRALLSSAPKPSALLWTWSQLLELKPTPALRRLALGVLGALRDQAPAAWARCLDGQLIQLCRALGRGALSSASLARLEAALTRALRAPPAQREELLEAAAQASEAPAELSALLRAAEQGWNGRLRAALGLAPAPEALAQLIEALDWSADDLAALRQLSLDLRRSSSAAACPWLRELALARDPRLRPLALRYQASRRQAALIALPAGATRDEWLALVEARWLARLERLPGSAALRAAGQAELIEPLALLERAHQLEWRLILAERAGRVDLRQLPPNGAFLRGVVQRGLDPGPWLAGLGARPLDSARGPLTLALEADGFEVLRCAQPLGVSSRPSREQLRQALSLGLDLNKRALHARDARGALVGRCLLGLTYQGSVVLGPWAALDEPERFQRAAYAYARDLADALGGGISSDTWVDGLVGATPCDLDGADWEGRPESSWERGRRLAASAEAESPAAWVARLRADAPDGRLSPELARGLAEDVLPSAHLRALVALLPRDPEVILRWAWQLRTSGEPELALQLLLEQDPASWDKDDERSDLLLASSLVELGRPGLALRTLRRTRGRLSLRSSEGAALAVSVRALLALGRRRRAWQILRAASPRSYELRMLQVELEGAAAQLP